MGVMHHKGAVSNFMSLKSWRSCRFNRLILSNLIPGRTTKAHIKMNLCVLHECLLVHLCV